MLERGVYVIGFSYPVVPQGKARIRTQVSAAHTPGRPGLRRRRLRGGEEGDGGVRGEGLGIRDWRLEGIGHGRPEI